MSEFLRKLRAANSWNLVALVVLVVGVVGTLFWQPAPNRVVIPLYGNEEQSLLQLYHRYGFPGPGSFFEYHSDIELAHQTNAELQVEFELPGWQKLRAVRFDVGGGQREYRLGPILFGYEFAYRFFPLFSMDGPSVVARAEVNDFVAGLEASGSDWILQTDGIDPYLVLPVVREEWRNTLDEETLWLLRGGRLLLYVLVAGLIFLAGRCVQSGWLERLGGPSTPLWNRLWGVGFVAALAAIGFAVYEPYLVFQKLYLFKDVATDSVDVFWPIFLNLSDYLRTEGWPLWSFSIGVGQGIFSWVGEPFLFLLYLLPPEKLAFGLGWMQFTKTILAGLLFLAWFRLLGMGKFASAAGALFLAFSAHMVIRGNWTHYATEVVMVAFALFAFECYLRKRIWQLIPLAILFMVIRSVYHSYVWSWVFFGYALLRIWMDGGFSVRETGRHLLRLGGCYILGLGLAGAFLLPVLYELISSPRVSGDESNIAAFATSSLFSWNEAEEWLASVYGLFAADLFGRGNFYSGWRNYLEGPHLYAGTLMLLLLPQAFVGRGTRVRVVLGIVLVAMLLYLFVPYVRYFLNAFSGIYYKTSSFWIPVFVAGAGALALDGLIRRRRLNLWLLGVTLACFLVALYLLRNNAFILEHLRVEEGYRVYRQVIILLIAYTVALLLLRSRQYRSYGLLLLPLMIATEVIQFSSKTAQDRQALRGDSMDTGAYYFDDSLQAVRMIEEADESFYRIEKGNVSAHLNDPLGQGYAGLSSYYSFNAGGYLAFLGPDGFEVDYLVPGHGSGYVIGTGERFLLATLLSTKYFIAREWGDRGPPPDYQPWGRAGDALISENENFIPLGSVYLHTISEERLRKLPAATRDFVAFAAAVVSGDSPLVANFPVLSDEELKRIEEATVQPDSQEAFAIYEELAQSLSEISVEWQEIGQNQFNGSITLDQPGIVFLSIPNNEGWTAKVNGEKAPFLSVHFGFRGLALPAGEHQIELHYFPPYLKAGIAMSVVSLLVFGILALTVRHGKESF
ncbi:MAG: YfhO family protein [Verrucomicrobiota bacterium]